MPAKRKPEHERCITIGREVMNWTMCVHVRIAERHREADFNQGEPYAAHPQTSGDLTLGGGTLGLTAYQGTEARDVPRPLTLNPELSYRDVHILGARELQGMVDTTKRIGKRLDKLRDQLGYTQDFGEHVLRLAAAVDAKWIAIHRRDVKVLTGHEPPEYGTWAWYEVRHVRHVLDAIRDHHLPTVEPLVQVAREALS
jgi:hypothetical protein